MFTKAMIRLCVLGPTGLALIIAMVLCPLSHGKGTFIIRVLDFLGISATPGAQKGEEAEFSGDIWVAELDKGERYRLVTPEGGYRSPVFMPGDKGILALKGDDLQFIPRSGGEPEKRATLPGIIKIVGFDKQDKDKLLILLKDSSGTSVGILSLKDRKVSYLPYDKQDEPMLNHLKGWERVYGDTTVEIKPDDSQQGKWINVYIKRGNNSPQNVSKCRGINCGQPSLSFDGNKVVYIKAQSQEPR